ncbi:MULTISPECIES: hypothetical protein [unclassified Micromonospora]|uniref:hypothetical protein n=1 Tax=unclassified Micromonospora TaxID=2617518 RepID=UPI0033195798
MADRVDPAAFRAAYNALMPHLPHAQVRGDIAERVVRAVVDLRTRDGLDRMDTLASLNHARQPVVAQLKAAFPEAYTRVTGRAVDDAVQAAARALLTGDEGSPHHFDSKEL